MKELFLLALLLAIIIPISTYSGMFFSKISEKDAKLLSNSTDILCQSKYSVNYPSCKNQSRYIPQELPLKL